MKGLKAPLTLALWKFIVSVAFGAIAVAWSGQALWAYLQPASFHNVTVLAIMIVAAKLFTYVSYGHVPLSAAQVAKAGTPVASVLLCRVLLGERFGLQSYLALVPIAVGVCLGVGVGVTDFNAVGIAAALLSSVIAAAQAVYMKTLFIARAETKAAPIPALTLNLIVAVCCVGLLLPLWAGVQVGVLSPKLDGGKAIVWRALPHAISHGRGPRLVLACLVGALTQYGQGACAYLVIERVSPATSSVLGTARKPFIVVVAMIIFHAPSTVLNVLGICLTFAGVFWYNHARAVEEREQRIVRVQPMAAQTHAAQALATHGDGDGDGDGEAEDDAEDDAMLQPPPPLQPPDGYVAWYEAELARRPLLVKAVTSCLLYAAGDLLAQAIAACQAHALTHQLFESGRFLRTLAYGGVFYPPLAHAHYNFLDWLVVERWRVSAAMVPWLKTFMEQFVYWSYLSNAYYHVVVGALQGLGPLQCLAGLADNFWPTMYAQWALWVPAQWLNFKYVPVRHQLGYVLVLSLGWTTFLSLAFPPHPKG